LRRCTKSDAIGLPFGISTKGGTGLKTGYPGGKLDVINATFGVTNFQTGEEKQASMGGGLYLFPFQLNLSSCPPHEPT
jgi:hypothetical protein